MIIGQLVVSLSQLAEFSKGMFDIEEYSKLAGRFVLLFPAFR
jgi:hypothetical protein